MRCRPQFIGQRGRHLGLQAGARRIHVRDARAGLRLPPVADLRQPLHAGPAQHLRSRRIDGRECHRFARQLDAERRAACVRSTRAGSRRNRSTGPARRHPAGPQMRARPRAARHRAAPAAPARTPSDRAAGHARRVTRGTPQSELPATAREQASARRRMQVQPQPSMPDAQPGRPSTASRRGRVDLVRLDDQRRLRAAHVQVGERQLAPPAAAVRQADAPARAPVRCAPGSRGSRSIRRAAPGRTASRCPRSSARSASRGRDSRDAARGIGPATGRRRSPTAAARAPDRPDFCARLAATSRSPVPAAVAGRLAARRQGIGYAHGRHGARKRGRPQWREPARRAA